MSCCCSSASADLGKQHMCLASPCVFPSLTCERYKPLASKAKQSPAAWSGCAVLQPRADRVAYSMGQEHGLGRAAEAAVPGTAAVTRRLWSSSRAAVCPSPAQLFLLTSSSSANSTVGDVCRTQCWLATGSSLFLQQYF